MHFNWNEKSIQWYLDASAYAEFHRKLAEEIRPYLEPEDTFCDLGCGLGRIDLELASNLRHITALDSNPRVLQILTAHAADRNIGNLTTVCGDAYTFRKPFDIVFLSFFGQSRFDHYLDLCRKTLIRVVNADNRGNLYPSRYRHTKKTTIAMAEQELKERGIRYRLLCRTIEFGQPLRSAEEALDFVGHQAPEATEEERRFFLKRYGVETGLEDFPLYLPNQKQIGIFLVECGDGRAVCTERRKTSRAKRV